MNYNWLSPIIVVLVINKINYLRLGLVTVWLYDKDWKYLLALLFYISLHALAVPYNCAEFTWSSITRNYTAAMVVIIRRPHGKLALTQHNRLYNSSGMGKIIVNIPTNNTEKQKQIKRSSSQQCNTTTTDYSNKICEKT